MLAGVFPAGRLLGGIELEPIPAEWVVEGVVRDERGVPLPGALISEILHEQGAVHAVSSVRMTTLSAEDGTFRLFPGVSPTSIEVTKRGCEIH